MTFFTKSWHKARFYRELKENIKQTHVSGESGLVTDGGGNTTQQSRHLGTGLRETENVVDEKQHILSFLKTHNLHLAYVN